MKIVKYNICTKDLLSYDNNLVSHLSVTADSVYFKINLVNTYDDMGLPFDLGYIKYSATCQNDCVDYTTLINKLSSSGITSPFMFGLSPNMQGFTQTSHDESPDTRFYDTELDDLFVVAGFVTGHTNDKLSLVRTYMASDQFVPGLDIDSVIYTNYLGDTIDGKTRLTYEGQPMKYVVDADDNQYIGTDAQTTGILYETYSGMTYPIQSLDGSTTFRPRTDIRFIGEGWNETNTVLSATTKKEYMMGIVFPPEIQSDVFINRSTISIIDQHERMSEIKTLDELLEYGNGFFKINSE